MSANLVLKQVNNQIGVFAKIDLKAGQTLLEFTGTKLLNEHIEHDNISPTDYLQIGKDLYLGLSGSFDDVIQHSCSPNSAVQVRAERAFLVALFDIKAGSEITFDYSLTSTQTPDRWLMRCKCNSYTCRKQISGYTFLPDVIKQYYAELDEKMGDPTAPFVPKYIRGK
jgi:SET domain-containing protein